MKAIVVRQLWATLIALEIKTIETRPAPPNGPMRPDGVRGLPGLPVERGERIAIVAGARRPSGHGDHYGEWRLSLGESVPIIHALSLPYRWHPLPLGAVVCTVQVDDALPIVDEWKGAGVSQRFLVSNGRTLALVDAASYGPVSGSFTPQLPLGDFTPGRWGWLLSDPQPCTPIPCKGRQGVFRLPDDVTEALGQEVGA
ncbi:MAG: hypothetical protein EKK62_11885 [Acidimicrobiia bacterium]|nr:MAG: hypothetical protein EKK62_11885 [Acidimicrobiia bacterium]